MLEKVGSKDALAKKFCPTVTLNNIDLPQSNVEKYLYLNLDHVKTEIKNFNEKHKESLKYYENQIAIKKRDL